MVLEHFKNISRVPRGSRNNQAISDYLVEFAKENNLRYYQDEALNVVIYKDASPGYENCPPLVMQGHMDMVCEKTADSSHDFTKDGITVIEEDGYLRADGTTLGGDDGIAIAYMLEYLTDDTLIHPPLEMVITTDEEIGMYGAAAFDISLLKGKSVINIDSEEEGIFTVACAGGRVGKMSYVIEREEYDGFKTEIKIEGLKGGHSGIDIGKNRWNAVHILGRVLGMLPKEICRVLSLSGGSKDNVIPNEASLLVVVRPDKKDEFLATLKLVSDILENEYEVAEPDAKFIVKADDKVQTYKVISFEDYTRLMCLFTLLPNGVQVMSASIPGMVESSCNLGVFEMTDTTVSAVVSMRSQKKSYIDYLSNKLAAVAAIVDAEYITYGGYPSWDMSAESAFRNLMCDVFRETYGRDAVVEGVHAGLEGGIFMEKNPDMDIISIGPNMHDIHTVKERIEIASVERVDKFLRNVIIRFAKEGK